jgi:predicted secreted Zn-dependent protease
MLRRLVAAVTLVAAAACGGTAYPVVDSETRARLPRSQAPELGEVEVTRSSATYSISGNTAEELTRAMHAHGSTWENPDAVGRTDVNLSTELRCGEYSDGGALDAANVRLQLTVTLPHWEERARAEPKLAKRWDRFIRALAAHEEGHVKIAIEHAHKLRAQLSALGPQASCEPLLTKAQTLGEQLGHTMKRVQLEFDARTGHGTLQGCVL